MKKGFIQSEPAPNFYIPEDNTELLGLKKSRDRTQDSLLAEEAFCRLGRTPRPRVAQFVNVVW